MNYSNSFSETASTNSHSTMNYNASNNTMIGLEGLNNNTNTSSPSESNLSEKDRQIFNNNNLRLAQLEKDIRVFTHYGGACDELMNWLIDDRAYSSMNEEALLKCLTAIFEKYIEHGRWSGIQILKTANERCASLSENAQALIKRYYHEACNTSQVRRLSEGSVTSNSSNLTMTGSPTSTRSIPNTSTPQSPITSNFLQNTQLTNLVKNILDGSTSPQPQQQTFPIQPAPPQYQIPLNPQASLQRHLMQQQYNNRQQHQQQQQVLQRNQQIQVQQQQQQQQHQQQYQQQQYQQQPPPQQQQQQQQQQQSPLQIHQYKHIQQQRITQQQQQFLQQRQAHLLHQQKVQQQVQMQAQQKAQNTPSGQQRLTQHFFVQNQRPPTTMPPSPAATTTTATTTNYLPQWNAELQHQVMRILNGEQMATLPNQPAIPATTNTQAYNGTPNTPAVNVPMYANQPTTPKVVNPPVYNGTPNNGPMVLPAQPTAPTLASGFVGTNQPVSSPQPSVSPATSPIRPIAPNPVPKAVTTPVSHPRQLHLPNLGPQVKKSKTLDKEKDRARFRFTKEYAIKPFRLVHDQPITGKMFYIPRPEFDLLCLNEDTLIDENDAFPMAFVFTSWYQDGAERKCDWPQSLRVELNGRPLPLQKKTKNTNNTGPPYVGKDYPFELTKQLRAGENSLRIHQVGCACSYYFCVQIFKRFSINAAKRMIEKATVSVTDTERMIRNYLGSMEDGDDDEIVILQRSIKLSLKCPISLKKIKIPTRGKHCKHLDCFDLVPYLLINENKTPQWACPCCSKTAYPDDLVRDLLIESLLKKLPKNVTEIEFETDEKNYKITKVDDQDSEDELVDDSDDDHSIKDKSSVEPVKKEEYAVAEIPNNATVIDLISDDDEEETTPQQQFKRRRDD